MRDDVGVRIGAGATLAAQLLLVVACAATPTPTPTVGLTGEATGVVLAAGGSVCPGSVTKIRGGLDGAAADAVEALQNRYENDPGFLAVVHDGATPVLVVDIGRLGEWQARLAQNGIPVAPSCVDTRLLAAVHAVLPQIARLQGGGMLAAYNALDDAIVVRGVDRDVLIAALIEVVPDAERAVLDAIAAGTLRIDPRKMDVLRLNPWTFS